MDKREFISSLKNNKIVLFGAGEAAINLLDAYPFLPVDAFWDNDPTRWGTDFCDRRITQPVALDSIKNEKLFILVTSMYWIEISSQLTEMGYAEGEDFQSINQFNSLFGKNQYFQPGHFYSPIPDVAEIKQNHYFENLPTNLNEIQLNSAKQIQLFKQLGPYIVDFQKNYSSKQFTRFYLNNNYFDLLDATVLYSMILFDKPTRIIEIGSGFTSALMLDVKELFNIDDLALTFIEPYPERLKSLLDSKDYKNVIIHEQKIQDVDKNIFSALEKDDILFIDSSHVSKIGSDVNYILFEILPMLKKGVKVHIHDIFYPFEYPEKWVYEGRFWNEAYILRAFLQYNDMFEIELWNHYLEENHKDLFVEEIDGISNGGSIWLRKK
ncbi:class I SAM-dependent methyltransferase [Sporosarcina sp. PTS2304]|uniref:class I SAM-dependent methyltransferase n=1 Tax=Sporosarcina sp. PTS2304 TaxID=2283194 RepID=UPI000E0D9613|nr:class I SAM-dependent methyltransferase [Sporosarcina sp. PTS2304]AXH98441.1 class I SAM-dependent methyltransferase [Sporosarcina sp. PTS2304]